MVDPLELGYDIGGNAVALALPGILWAAWFLLAFEHDAFASSVGFGRKAFWLLLPGALAASLALLPIAPVTNDWLAISFAGAVFPLFAIALAFDRFAPPRRRSLIAFVSGLVVLTGLLLGLVLPVGGPFVTSAAGALGASVGGTQDLLVAVVATVLAAAAVAVARGPTGRALGALFGLTAGVVVLTFAFSAAIPGVGIEENFPAYLVPPIGAGVVAAALAGYVVPRREALALPLAFAASTFGVLVGADVLRQPPLYNGGPSGLYTIGGAGVLDLVYLSGLLGLVSAYGMHRLLGRGFAPVGDPAPPETVAPTARLVRAYKAGLAGRVDESLADAAAAARDAALQAGRLLGRPPPPDDRPWDGLPVPGWIVSDSANLDSAARARPTDAREGYRGWLTARWMVHVGRELGARRFGSVGRRAAAFGIDLAVVTLPAIAIWAALCATFSGGLTALLESVAFNAAAYGFVAVAFLYFVLAETVAGTTVGKGLLGLVVRDRALGRPGFLSLLVRNAPLLPALTVLGIGGPVAVAFLVKAGAAGGAVLDGVVLPGGLLAFVATLGFVVGGLALLGSFGILLMVLSAERQRLGDLLAGTWVVRR